MAPSEERTVNILLDYGRRVNHDLATTRRPVSILSIGEATLHEPSPRGNHRHFAVFIPIAALRWILGTTPEKCRENADRLREILASTTDEETSRKISEVIRAWNDLRDELLAHPDFRTPHA